jgi:hydrogenase maturation protease
MNIKKNIACAVLVVGLGNELLGDDGFGPEALRRLTLLRDWPDEVSFVDAGQGISLCVGEMACAGTVLALDAVRGGRPPGTVYEFEVGAGDDAGDERVGPGALDPHAASFVVTVDLARWLTGLPARALVLGVEPLSVDAAAALSAPVREVVDQVVSRAAAIVERSLARTARGPG